MTKKSAIGNFVAQADRRFKNTEGPHGRQDKLLDLLQETLQIRSDLGLAKFLGCTAPYISKVRHGHLAARDMLILRIHERAGIPVWKIRKLIHVPK